jgi:hypothetical protein
MNLFSMRKSLRHKLFLGSLFGTGAAFVGASEANAGIIVTKVNENIGSAPGDMISAVFPLAGGAQLAFGGLTVGFFTSTAKGGTTFVTTNRYVTLGGVALKATGPTYFVPSIERFLAGVKWKSAPVGTISNHYGVVGGSSVFSDQYFLFHFQNGTTTDYGWILGSYSPGTYNIDSYAYDNTGAEIASGQTSSSSSNTVPEPTSLVVLAALAALCTGAAGVRRWKSARQKLANSTAVA